MDTPGSTKRELTPEQRREALGRIAAAVCHHEERARQAAREALAHKIEVGKVLLEAKALLPYGEFSRWAELTFGWSVRHCQRHMLLATHATQALAAAGPEGSMRAALSACTQGSQGAETWLLVGRLECAPGEEPDPAALVETIKTWRVRKG